MTTNTPYEKHEWSGMLEELPLPLFPRRRWTLPCKWRILPDQCSATLPSSLALSTCHRGGWIFWGRPLFLSVSFSSRFGCARYIYRLYRAYKRLVLILALYREHHLRDVLVLSMRNWCDLYSIHRGILPRKTYLSSKSLQAISILLEIYVYMHWLTSSQLISIVATNLCMEFV